MPDDKMSPKVLADSLYSKPTPKWMFSAGLILGLILECRAAASFVADGLSRAPVIDMLLGAICAYSAGISRKMYLSDIGIVREMRGWGRVVRRVISWNDVRHVSLAFRADKMMAFFEIDAKGWKVLFSKDQEQIVRDILYKMLPDSVDVKTLTC
jgi:hypothetical protein